MRIRKSMWRRSAARAAVATALAALAMLAPPAAAAGGGEAASRRATRTGDDFEWHGEIGAGRAIEIKGVNGGIVAEAAAGNQVEVVARKSGRRSDPDEVRIEVIEHAEGVTLCAVYPTPRGERSNECGPDRHGRMSTRNNDVQVEFTVRVPAGVRFIGRTVNGSIEAHGLASDAEGHTVNGSVAIATRGIARASTANGSIEAEMGTVPREALEFETVNGGITLIVPAGSGAEVRASTVNGDILTDFPLTIRGKFSRRHLSGTIGRGGPQLMMSTVNGDIRLRSAS